MRKIFSKKALGFIVILLLFVLFFAYKLNLDLLEAYERNQSAIIRDRNGNIIAVLPNERGHYAVYAEEVPGHIEEILLLKEDRYFRWHIGINPWSSLRAGAYQLGIGDRKASSTISQQLAKVLLENEFERTALNKIKETAYAFALELFQSKDDILKMYSNSVYFGHQSQGIKEASRLYFNLDPEFLSRAQAIQLLSSINHPLRNNPAAPSNADHALVLAERFSLQLDGKIYYQEEVEKNMELRQRVSESFFEIKEIIAEDEFSDLTVDENITKAVREIVRRNINELSSKNVSHGAVIILRVPENEILALVGSPNPYSRIEGQQINMLGKERAIGSTIKPFIYLKAFEKGIRPYTLIDDREYKYVTLMGFPLYPKNFDYQYRGLVSVHYALSNSLNVPTVKALEYVGLEDFYRFLQEDLLIKPVQKIENYQLGIALGSFEMSLYELARIFTIFTNEGKLKDLKISASQSFPEKRLVDEKYVQLVNRILNDRKRGIEQFGFHGELNLFQDNYALKTGTSRDFRDSWIMGYTPDFLVGVWVGNADLSPTDEVSGQAGAGKIWAETMQLLFHSEYNKKTPFDFSLTEEFVREDDVFFGLPDDRIDYRLFLLTEKEGNVILSPHNNDYFLFKKDMEITLLAGSEVSWYVNEELIAVNKPVTKFSPALPGVYKIEARSAELYEEIFITVN